MLLFDATIVTCSRKIFPKGEWGRDTLHGIKNTIYFCKESQIGPRPILSAGGWFAFDWNVTCFYKFSVWTNFTSKIPCNYVKYKREKLILSRLYDLDFWFLPWKYWNWANNHDHTASTLTWIRPMYIEFVWIIDNLKTNTCHITSTSARTADTWLRWPNIM